MAQIKARKAADGSMRYTAVIRIREKGKTIHQEARTFAKRTVAVDWGREREAELARPGAMARARFGTVTLGHLIERYISEFEPVSRWQRTKGADLRRLLKHPIAQEDALTLTERRLIRHVQDRRADGAGPSTVLNDLVWIGVVLRTAAAVWGAPVSTTAAQEARAACTQLRLIAKSRKRERTPTYDELAALDAYFERRDRDGRAQIKMRAVMWFAIYSARRETEICMLIRSDNDADRRTGIVRDAKHPTAKIGNHRTFRYTPEAWQIMAAQPVSQTDPDRPFPYTASAISARFTRACKMLGIEDLRFHDLRHEATTRLFEQGLTIPDVAAHTLHESWGVLKRYTHIVARGRIMHAPFLGESTSSITAPPGSAVAPR